MAFDPNDLNTENTPARWRIQGKRLAESGTEGAAEMAKLSSVYQATLTKAATFTSDTEMGVGNQPGVGSEPEPIMVSSISITGAGGLDMIDGGSQELNLDVTVLPIDAEDSSVRYSSSDPDIITVTPAYGLVEAIGVGTATITATANDGSGVVDTVDITVVDTTE